jgi:hypothetical protein
LGISLLDNKLNQPQFHDAFLTIYLLQAAWLNVYNAVALSPETHLQIHESACEQELHI